MTGRGLILAAPGSASGKTTLTLGLLRAYRNRHVAVRGAKSGPDYIDPRFHEAASGRVSPNLDAWAMGADRLGALAAGDGLLLIEGAMGLFDGAPPDGWVDLGEMRAYASAVAEDEIDAGDARLIRSILLFDLDGDGAVTLDEIIDGVDALTAPV